jgi:hypothetical protein
MPTQAPVETAEKPLVGNGMPADGLTSGEAQRLLTTAGANSQEALAKPPRPTATV